jgi:hypothetical protein
MNPDHIDGIVIGDRDRREAGKMLYIIDIDPPAIDAEPTVAILPGHEILRGRLGTSDRGEGGQIGSQFHLRIESGIDGPHNIAR